MARPLLIERAGGGYHVAARGNEQKPIYRDDHDRGHFLELSAKGFVNMSKGSGMNKCIFTESWLALCARMHP